MQSFVTLVLVLLPLFIGFLVPSSQRLLKLSETGINLLVIILLAYIGIELSQIDNLWSKLSMMFTHVLILSVLTIGSGVLAAVFLDKLSTPDISIQVSDKKESVSLSGSFIQISSVIFGVIVGQYLPDWLVIPSYTMTVLLMILILLVGIGLKCSGITLKEVLLNKQGLKISVVFVLSITISGLVYAAIIPEMSLFKALALVSGYGWYSLSGMVITDAYGALWGSVALLNDMIRELFSLVFIPFLMRKSVSAGVSVGGATSLDFTLPIIQQSGGLQVVPIAISFGFITNLIAPVLMVFFSSLG